MPDDIQQPEENAADQNTGGVDVSNYRDPHTTGNRIARVIWGAVWTLLFRLSPRKCNRWRRMLLRMFGAKIGRGVNVAASARIWGPWNLEMDDYSCIGPHVDCSNVAPVRIGKHSTVSQYSYLCTGSHDFEKPRMPLITAPITMGDQAWICADVFVGPGVTIGQGAVVGARSTVMKDVAPWTVAAGNPVKFIKKRVVREE